MANNIPFQASGKTYQVSANTTSQVVTITPDGPCNQVLVANHENASTGKPVYFRISNLSNVAVTAPSAGSPQYAFLMVPSTTRSYTVPWQFGPSAPLYIAYITESGTAECYFTPGEGI